MAETYLALFIGQVEQTVCKQMTNVKFYNTWNQLTVRKKKKKAPLKMFSTKYWQIAYV